jgi:hypothetical protein
MLKIGRFKQKQLTRSVSLHRLDRQPIGDDEWLAKVLLRQKTYLILPADDINQIFGKSDYHTFNL